MRVAEGHGDLGQVNGGDCHRVKWCPCLLDDDDDDDGDDDDNKSSDDVNKLLVVVRARNVSTCLLSFAPHDHQNLTSLLPSSGEPGVSKSMECDIFPSVL